MSMQKFNRYSFLLIITTALYFLIQILFSWRMEPSGKASLYAFISSLIIAGNIFFIIRLNNKKTDQLLKVFNSYLLISTFIFYLAYCLKASLITTNADNLETPLLLELILLVTLLFNGYQIFIHSREIKAADKKKSKKKRGFVNEIFSWVDALLSAVIFVLLINMFLIQIYSIPSESMFPVFFVSDRPVVDKLTRGPEIPFTRFRIPPLQKINRGDIVTFRNPKHKKTVESELKHLFSQFLYMITFTTVNIDKYDDTGRIKADPLVKRVVALPGEQVQMINDKIYHRDNLNDEFTLLEENINSQTDLYKLDQYSLSKLQRLPLDQRNREMLSKWDEKIENLDRDSVISQIRENKRLADEIRSRLIINHMSAVRNGLQGKIDRINRDDLSINAAYSPFQKLENVRDDNVHFVYNLQDQDIWNQGWDFILKHNSLDNVEPFFVLAANMDLSYKLVLSEWLLNNLDYLESLFSAKPVENFESKLQKDEISLGEIYNYIKIFYDFRNMAPFPQNSLIEEGNYFVMGDNRYSSIDLRHGLNAKDRFFIENDSNSLVYKSYLSPMTIEEKWIEGFVIFRLFPLNRIGIP